MANGVAKRIGGAVLLSLAGLGFGWAQTAEPSVDTLVRDLMPPPPPVRARGVVVEAQTPDPCAAARGRGIVVEPTTPVADVIAAKPCFPAVNIQVNFDYNSDHLTPLGLQQLDKLAAVLQDPRIKGSSFLVGGHTDAKGSDPFNDDLSKRRAAAVLGYLVGHHHLSAEHLKAIGFGKRNPKAGIDPFDGANRRVEVVNVSAK